jgi:hypothetical protein
MPQVGENKPDTLAAGEVHKAVKFPGGTAKNAKSARGIV